MIVNHTELTLFENELATVYSACVANVVEASFVTFVDF